MNSNSVTSSGTNISDLIAQVLDRFDTDKDGKMSSQEFGNFLTGLLSGATSVGGATTLQSGLTNASSGEYRQCLAGFDCAKLDNPTLPGAGTSKYRAARIFQDFKPMPESLPAIVERLRAEGLNATQVSHDKIDFGDGYGPIDVIQGAYPGGGVAWQWMPQNA